MHQKERLCETRDGGLIRADLVTRVRNLARRRDGLAAATERNLQRDHDQAAALALAAALEAERRLAEQAARIALLERLVSVDALTGVLNRRGFRRHLRRAVAAANRHGEHGVLIYVDLDGFKPINDTYGHPAGDRVLCEVARVLEKNIRETDSVGRLGGDEFAILLTRTPWRDGEKRAHALGRLINDTVVNWNGRMLAVGASMGIQPYGPHDDDETVLGLADRAMYRNKRKLASRSPRSIDA